MEGGPIRKSGGGDFKRDFIVQKVASAEGKSLLSRLMTIKATRLNLDFIFKRFAYAFL